MRERRPVLYLVACGGRPAGRLDPLVERLQYQGWEVCVVATPSAVKFMDPAALAARTGHVVRAERRTGPGRDLPLGRDRGRAGHDARRTGVRTRLKVVAVECP